MKQTDKSCKEVEDGERFLNAAPPHLSDGGKTPCLDSLALLA